MNYELKRDQPLSVTVKNKSNEWECVVPDLINEEELWKEWVCIRSPFRLSFPIDQSIQQETYRTELVNRLAEAKAKLLDTLKPTLKIDGSEILLKAGKVMSGIGKNGKVSAALSQKKQANENGTTSGFSTLNIQVLSDSMNELSSVFTSKPILNGIDKPNTLLSS